MGRLNQQHRATKAKARRRRHAAQPHAATGHPVAGGGERAAAETPSAASVMAAEEEHAHAIAEAIVLLSARDDARAEVVVRWLIRRGDDPERRVSITGQLSRLLIARTADAWSGGWRPVDVHTFIGRELDAAAQALAGDVMAADLGAYAEPTLAETWPEQLRTIGARRWWPANRDFVTHRAANDGFEPTLRTALRLAAVASTLPVIERLDPLPGHAHPQRSDRHIDQVDPRLLERVRRLLAQAESTPYEAEADTFTSAAQSLMARHSLDVAMLSAAAERHTDRATPIRVWIERPYEQEKVRLLGAVADANRSRTVWTSGLGFVTVVGHSSDLAAVEAIFTSLLLQATRAMVGEGRQMTASGASRTRSFRRSFLAAYAVRIGDRLRGATEAETESALRSHDAEGDGLDESRALVRVLADRSAEVDAKVDELFPRLVHKPSRFTPDAHGWWAGQRAADRASLSGAAAALDRSRDASSD